MSERDRKSLCRPMLYERQIDRQIEREREREREDRERERERKRERERMKISSAGYYFGIPHCLRVNLNHDQFINDI